MNVNVRVYALVAVVALGGLSVVCAQGGNFSSFLQGLSLEGEVARFVDDEVIVPNGPAEQREGTDDGLARERADLLRPVEASFWPYFEFYFGARAWANLFLNHRQAFVGAAGGYGLFVEEMYWNINYLRASLARLPQGHRLVRWLNVHCDELRYHLWRLAGQLPERTYRAYYHDSDAVDTYVRSLFAGLMGGLGQGEIARLEVVRGALNAYRDGLGVAMRGNTPLYGTLMLGYLLNELTIFVLELIPEWSEVALETMAWGRGILQAVIARLQGRLFQPMAASLLWKTLSGYLHYRLLQAEMQTFFETDEARDIQVNTLRPWFDVAARVLTLPPNGYIQLAEARQALEPEADAIVPHRSESDEHYSESDDDDSGDEASGTGDIGGVPQATPSAQQHNQTQASVHARNAFYGVPVWVNARLYDEGGRSSE